MNVTDLIVEVSGDTEEKQQAKADLALQGKHKQTNPLDMNKAVTSSDILAEPVLDTVTPEEIKRIYPVKVNPTVLQRATDIINASVQDMDYVLAKEFRDNVFGFIDIIKESKHRVAFEDYVNACKFVTFKMAGNTDIRAYALTFPDRVRRMEREKVPNSHLYQYANLYAKNKTVVEVMTKVMIPTHVLYQDIFHKAVKTQAELMQTAKSEKVRADAANSLMTHLKTPEIKKAELQVNVGSTGAIDQLSEALANLSGKQSEMLSQGKYSLQDIREATIIEVTDED